MKGIDADRIGEMLETIWLRIPIVLMVIWRLPIVQCPSCRGAGGRMCGYYEPEWEECRHCWYQTAWLEDHGLEWFVGRVNPLRWPWVHLSAMTGQASFTGWLLCWLGLHDRGKQGVCRRCWDYDEGERVERVANDASKSRSSK